MYIMENLSRAEQRGDENGPARRFRHRKGVKSRVTESSVPNAGSNSLNASGAPNSFPTFSKMLLVLNDRLGRNRRAPQGERYRRTPPDHAKVLDSRSSA
jgi:hypothetical protein